MSSCFIKALKCFFCSDTQLIETVDFPEDCFDEIRRYKSDQLLWICNLCKNDSSRMINYLANSDRSVKSKSRASYLNLDVCCDVEEKKQTSALSVNDCKDEELTECELRNGVYYARNIEDDKVEKNKLFGSPSLPSSSSSISKTFQNANLGSLSQPNTYKEARKYVHKVVTSIKIPEEENSKNKQLVTSVLKILVENLKKNEEVNAMLNTLYYTGSAYSDLRIISATEYDIDLVLKVPDFITLIPDSFTENYAYAKLKWRSETLTDFSKIDAKFFDENSVNNYLQPQKVLSWLQGHIDLVLKQELELPQEVLKVKTSSSGPARTIVIVTTYGYTISIDLVPVFEFDHSLLHGVDFYHKIIESYSGKNSNRFYVVPKECTTNGAVSCTDSKFYWRLDFPNIEKSVLHGKECAKPVIKILKTYRDKMNWKGLASYYLKMVVILEIIENSSQDYWKNGNLFHRLLDCFRKLMDYLKNENLPHFLTQENLLSKFSRSQSNKESATVQWSNHLRNEIKLWESNPKAILKLLNVK